MTPPRVETVSGTLEGTVLDASPPGIPLVRFLGVPYAAPPVGARRWTRPAPAAPWVGVRGADTFGPAAPQRAGLSSPLPSFTPGATAEDCLTLNVWTPDLRGHRPVMVWIHGGAFTTGGSSQPVYDGARLAAEHDLVVVTINYRIGALGFLHPVDAGPDTDVVANAGLHDQRAALSWVHAHAAALGGDPATITVFGESAGAGSILHLVSAATAPPVRRAIAQSGEPHTLDADEARATAVAFAAAVGVDRADTALLQNLPVDALLAAQDRVFAERFAATGTMPFAPGVDGQLLDQDVQAAFRAGRGTAIDLLLGTTRDELRLFPDPTAATLDDARLQRRVRRLAPDADPGALIAAYRTALAADASCGDVWDAVRTDTRMRIPNLQVAEARAATGAAAFVYRFDWAAPGLGAAHAVDIPFTFGTFDHEGWGDAVGYDRDAETLGVGLRAAWAAFARLGTADTDTLGPWPRYEAPRRAVMRLGRDSGVVDDPDGPVRAQYR
ncbi:MAG TPA: carboxylesterase family protein [Acidimicrobiia bacterium]|nr:carboxylesterase family protein [Acidimicrobiia bacterium]